MKIIRSIKNTDYDIFLPPIPRWITFYGFWGIIIIFLVLLFTTTSFRFYREVRLHVFITDSKGCYIEADFKTAERIHINQKISITMPLSNVRLSATAKTDKFWIEGNKVYIPISLENISIKQLPIKKQVQLEGILTESQSLIDTFRFNIW